MSEETFNVGDVVQSRRCPTLIGVVEKVTVDFVEEVILVRVNERPVLSPAAYWRRIKDLKRKG